jgi:hypothetical protein
MNDWAQIAIGILFGNVSSGGVSSVDAQDTAHLIHNLNPATGAVASCQVERA